MEKTRDRQLSSPPSRVTAPSSHHIWLVRRACLASHLLWTRTASRDKGQLGGICKGIVPPGGRAHSSILGWGIWQK